MGDMTNRFNDGDRAPVRPQQAMAGQRPVRPQSAAGGQRAVRPSAPSVQNTDGSGTVSGATTSSSVRQSPISDRQVKTPNNVGLRPSKDDKLPPIEIEPLPIADRVDTKVEGKQNFVLYAIVDKQIDGMIDYFRYYGIKISHIFTNVDDVRETMLMQLDPSLLMVIDTGSGKFVNMAVRNNLIDLLGMMDDENKAIIFYSDSNLEYDIKYAPSINNKDIKWFKYKSTAGVLADMIQDMKLNNINYMQDSEYGRTTKITEDLKFRGTPDPEYVKTPKGNVQINTKDIVARQQQGTADYPMMERFKAIIR